MSPLEQLRDDPLFRAFRRSSDQEEGGEAPDVGPSVPSLGGDDPLFQSFRRPAPLQEDPDAGMLPGIRAAPPGGRSRPAPLQEDPDAGRLPGIRAAPPGEGSGRRLLVLGPDDPADMRAAPSSTAAAPPREPEAPELPEVARGFQSPATESERLRAAFQHAATPLPPEGLDALRESVPEERTPLGPALARSGQLAAHTIRDLTASIPEVFGIAAAGPWTEQMRTPPSGMVGSMPRPSPETEAEIDIRRQERKETLMRLAEWIRGPDLEAPADPRVAESYIVNTLVPGVTSMLYFLGAGAAAGPLGAGFVAATSGQSRGWHEAKEQGLSDEDARHRAIQATIPGVVQVLTPLTILARLNRATGGALIDRLKHLAGTVGISSVNEMIVNSAGEVGFNIIAERPAFENFWTAFRDGGVVAFLTAGLLGGPQIAVQRTTQARYLRQTEEAIEAVDQALKVGVGEDGAEMTAEDREDFDFTRRVLERTAAHHREQLGIPPGAPVEVDPAADPFSVVATFGAEPAEDVRVQHGFIEDPTLAPEEVAPEAEPGPEAAGEPTAVPEAPEAVPEAPGPILEPEAPAPLPEAAPGPEAVPEAVPEGPLEAPGPEGDQPTVTGSIPLREPIQPAAVGGTSRVRLPDGREVQVRYEIIDARTAPTSHNPETLQPEPDYPGVIQERRYHADATAREDLQEGVRTWRPSRIVDPTRDALGGPPIVREDGVRLSGNFRGMLTRLVALQSTPGFAQYLDEIASAAGQFGLEEASVREAAERIMQEGGVPELVRTIHDPSLDLESAASLQELVSAFNDVQTRTRDPLGGAQTRARRLEAAEGALQHFQDTVGPEQTLRSYLRSAAGRRFIERLVEDGVISREEAGSFIDRRTGIATQEGMVAVERMMRASVIQDADVVDRAPDSWLQKIDRAVPAILHASKFEGWDVRDVISEALDIGAVARASGATARDIVSQRDLVREPFSLEAQTLAIALQDHGPVRITEMFRAFAMDAESANQALESEDLFGYEPPSPADAFHSRFGREDAAPGESIVLEDRVRAWERLRRRIAGIVSPELQREAERDELTGLPNVRTERRQTRSALERRRGARGDPLLVRYRIDLDNFKALNDARGHAAGDEALQVVARVLQESTREGDPGPGRVGGDEFSLTLRMESGAANPAALRDRLEGLIADALEEAGLADAGRGRRVGASIGFAVAEPGSSFADLDRAADLEAIARKRALHRSEPRNARPGDYDVLTPGDMVEDTISTFGSETEAVLQAKKVEQLSFDFASRTRVPAVELSYETAAARIEEIQGSRAWVDQTGKTITSPEDVYKLMWAFRSPQVEVFHALFMDDAGTILGHELLTSGSNTAVRFHEGFVDNLAFKARMWGATRMVFAHNHPAGDPTPSQKDVAATAQLAFQLFRQGVRVDGQMVLDHGVGYWIGYDHESGLTRDPERMELPDFREIPDWTDSQGPQVVMQGGTVAGEWSSLITPRDPSHFNAVFVDARGRVLGIAPFGRGSLRDMQRWLPEMVKRIGAFKAVLVTADPVLPGEREAGLDSRMRRIAGRPHRQHGSVMYSPGIAPGESVFHDVAQAVGRHTGIASVVMDVVDVGLEEFGPISARAEVEGFRTRVYDFREVPSARVEATYLSAVARQTSDKWIYPATEEGQSSADDVSVRAGPGQSPWDPIVSASLFPLRPHQTTLEEFAGPMPEGGTEDFMPWLRRKERWQNDVLAAVSEGVLPLEDARAMQGAPSPLTTMKPVPDVPLYHVTTSLAGVLDQGLRTREQLGLGGPRGLGGRADNTVSFTTSLELAEAIRDTLLLAGQVLRRDITLEELVEQARTGEGAEGPYLRDLVRNWSSTWTEGMPFPPGLQDLLEGIERSHSAIPRTAAEWSERGFEPGPPASHVDGSPWIHAGTGERLHWTGQRPMTAEELLHARMSFLQRWLAVRSWSGGPTDPMFFSTSPAHLATTDPDQVAILQARPLDGAHGDQMAGMDEWRLYSGRAVEILNIDGNPANLLLRDESPLDSESWSEKRIAPVVYQSVARGDFGSVMDIQHRRFLDDVREFVDGPARQVPRRSEIVKDIERVMDRMIRVGRWPRLRRSFGFYRTGSEDIRTRIANDVDVVSHEFGHHMHKLIFGVEPEPTSRFKRGRAKRIRGEKLEDKPLELFKPELEPLARTSDKTLAEGWAELWRIWITNRERAYELAPNTLQFIETRLAEDFPQVWAGVQRWQRDYEAYASGSSYARLRAQMADGPVRGQFSILRGFQRIYRNVWHNLEPLDRMERELTGIRRPTADEVESFPGFLADLYRGAAGRADHFIRRAPLDHNTLKPMEETWVVDQQDPDFIALQQKRALAAQAGVEIKPSRYADQVPRKQMPAKSLEAILDQVGDRMEEFEVYMIARRARELHARPKRIETGLEGEDVRNAIEQLEEAHPEFIQAFEELQGYNNALLMYLRDAGVISDDAYWGILLNNFDYAPFYRVFQEGEAESGGLPGGSGLFGHVFSPIRRIKGSGRDILSPLDSIVKHTFLYTKLAAKQETARAIQELASIHGSGKWLSEVKPPPEVTRVKREEVLEWLLQSDFFADVEQAEGVDVKELIDDPAFVELFESAMMVYRPGDFFGKPNVISFLQPDGRRRWFEVDPDVWEAYNDMDPALKGVVTRIAAYPAQWLRVGQTLSPEFQIRNPWRDQWLSFVQSEYGYLPGIDFVRGMFHYLSRDDLYWKWKASGSEFASLVDMDRDAVRERMQQMAEAGVIPYVMKHPLDSLRIVSASMENASRLGETINALRAGGERMGVLRRLRLELDRDWRREARERLEDPTRGELLIAGHAGREIGSNYSNVGAWGPVVAMKAISTFWNARIQGHARLIRSMREDPVGTSLRATMGITVPTIILYMVNREDPEFFEIPQWMRDLFWMIKVPNPLRGAIPSALVARPEEHSIGHQIVRPFVLSGDRIWLRFPRPFEAGIIFGAIPERILEWWDTNDAEGLSRAMNETVLREIQSTLLPTPQAVTPFVENWINWSFFLRRPIDDRSVAEFHETEPRFRRRPRTSPLAAEMAEFIHRSGADRMPGVKGALGSPQQIEHAWRSWTGGLGGHFLRGMDQAYLAGLRFTGREMPPERPAPTTADVPLVGGFVARDPGFQSESRERFYRRLNEVNRAKSTVDMLTREGRDGDLDRFMTQDEQAELLQEWGELQGVAAQLQQLTAEANRIQRMPPEIMNRVQKHQEIKELGEQSRRIAAEALERLYPSGTRFPLTPSQRTDPERMEGFRRP